ncbi:hypothetical protein EXIGLDRAFT_731978 [Exidia glandulosa HHB12029]|uniref:Uncharacterized protein n=1 Tax=Exidia glandulosa HHB12029 TaxID=1314781 RepID=A0A165BNW3_EXIGL|nr:hypothetical protein EXIGLDRAFT_731978 [Exidia glandulosa HHB12029]
MAHPFQNYAGAYPSQNACYYPASDNAHNQPMHYQPSEYLPGAGLLVSSGMMTPAQEPAVTPRPRTRNPHYDPILQTQQNYYQQAASSHTSTAVPVMPPQDSFGYHPPHMHPQSTFQHSAFPAAAQPSQSLMIPSDYTYTIETALVPLNSGEQSTTQRCHGVREPATRPARVGTLAPDSLLFQPFVPKFNAQPAPQQPQPVDEVIEDDAWLQFLAQYPPPPPLGF